MGVCKNCTGEFPDSHYLTKGKRVGICIDCRDNEWRTYMREYLRNKRGYYEKNEKELDAISLNKREYRSLIMYLIKMIPKKFRDPNFSVDYLITEAYLYMMENELNDMNKCIMKVFSKSNWEYAKSKPYLVKQMNDISAKWQRENPDRVSKIQAKYNQKNTELVNDAYCRRVLRSKFDNDYILKNPSLIEETRQRILNKRNKKSCKIVG